MAGKEPGSSGEPGADPLTAFQIEVSRVFLDLPQSAGFLLAGGAALAAQGLTDRPTQDLDLFTSPGHGLVADAMAGLQAAAVDATPQGPATTSLAGPTLALEDLAGRKVVALFDVAEARDFADVHALANRYGKQPLFELAAATDAGFDTGVIADMLESHARFTDEEIPAPDVSAVRDFAAGWAVELRQTQR